MNRVRLGDVAEVILSNIDKKSVDGQAKVRLCNFTDVYYNWAITQEMYESFMKATATNSQIDSLSISKGMVAMTKDSETKYDIGISVYIADDFDDVVLGYHCVLIKPNKDLLSGKYLNVILNSSYAQKYFENHASGSGQRYTLSKEVIEDMRIPYVAPEEQNKIGNIFSKIDRKIEINKKINDNLLAMAYDIYMYSFYGKIPNGKLKDILVEADKSSVQVGEAKQSTGEYPFFTSGSAILKWDTPFVNGRNCFLNTGGNADVKFYVGEAAYSTDTWCISSNKNMSDYLYLLLVSIKPELNQKFFQGTGLKHLQKPLLKDRDIYIPDFEELQIFNEQVNPMFNVISENTRENQELIALRDWLLPMLMNGQATISD